MTLDAVIAALPVVGMEDMAFPRRLLGAFRRKSISFCTGVTDETSIVYWFQSKRFTIDLRLPDGNATAVQDRQGWIGDTLWDRDSEHMSWSIPTSYQPRDQWPEPASFRFIGNNILEFAPSGAYVEDWRQQCGRGPLLGLRLLSLRDEESGQEWPMAGGLIVAGEHMAYARSCWPMVDDTLRGAASLDQALADGVVTAQEVESYAVSVAMGGRAVRYSTQPAAVGQDIASGAFALQPDGGVILSERIDDRLCHLRFAVDIHIPDFSFACETACTADAQRWMAAEKRHLFRHAAAAL